MKIFGLLILFFSTAGFAREVYTFGDALVSFHKIDVYTVSSDCKDDKCLALVQAKKHSKTSLKAEQLQGGRNPSSVRCRTFYGGKVVLGKDQVGNDQSFCLFSDGSYLR